MKAGNENIGCNVKSCKYIDNGCKYCLLKKVMIKGKILGKTKEATMCDSYEAK